MSQPPLLPDEALSRVMRLARMDALSILVVASVFAIMSAAAGNRVTAGIGLLAAGAGAIEWHGVALLRQWNRRGMNWLIASQPLLLATVLGYCWYRLTHVELPPIPDSLRSTLETTASQLGMTADDYLRLVHKFTYWLLAFVSIVYQGGLTIYYVRRQPSVDLALPDDDTDIA